MWVCSKPLQRKRHSAHFDVCHNYIIFTPESSFRIPSSAIGGMRQRSFQLLVFTYGFTYCAGISPPHVASLCGAVDPSSLTLPDRAVVSLSVDGCC